MNEGPATPGSRSRSIALMVLAVCSFTVLDSTAKHLSTHVPILQLVWGRYVFGLLFVLICAPVVGWRVVVTTTRPVFQVLRGCMLVGATGSIFLAVKYLPLAETYAISFVSPFIVAIAGVVFLGEHVGRWHWVAIAGGFAGVLVVMRPGGAIFGWAVVFPLLMACFWSVYQLMTRVLGSAEHPATTLFYTFATGTVALGATVIGGWSPLAWHAWGWLVFMGVVGSIGQLLLIRAYADAPASLLSPFVYTQIAWAMLIGLVVFGDVPDMTTLAGTSLVVVSGLLLLCLDDGVRPRVARRARAADE